MLKIDGKEYTVTAKFQEILARHPDLAAMHYDTLAVERNKLITLSTLRANHEVELPPDLNGKTLTANERDRVYSIQHVMNVHKAIRTLCGADHVSLGFACADQVHTIREIKDCGCVNHHAFDHYAEDIDRVNKKYPHAFDRKCDAHK